MLFSPLPVTMKNAQEVRYGPVRSGTRERARNRHIKFRVLAHPYGTGDGYVLMRRKDMGEYTWDVNKKQSFNSLISWMVSYGKTMGVFIKNIKYRNVLKIQTWYDHRDKDDNQV
jgi:hypothetical protein